jgi:hypothetical protein
MNNPADEISQAIKRKILADRARLATYHAHGQAAIDDERQGRFAALSKATVVGTSPSIQYPRQPADSPANQFAMSPPEPPLGYSVNDQEPTGESWEQKASDRPAPEVRRRRWRRV